MSFDDRRFIFLYTAVNKAAKQKFLNRHFLDRRVTVTITRSFCLGCIFFFCPD